MDFFERIKIWNEERGLLGKGFNHTREASFIVEELLESTGKYDSLTAREKASELAEQIINDTETTPELVVDAFADIIVFATGAIEKNGYNASQVMEEVYKELDSRTGTMVDGKFVKDIDAILYKADLTSCKRN